MIGDVDGDGRAEIVVAAPNCGPDALELLLRERRGRIVVCSGADGDVLEELEDPEASAYAWTSVARCGDLDGDGRADLAVGIGALDDGNALAYSTRDWRELLRVRGNEEGFGSALADAGDIDGDGVHDLVVGASSASADQMQSRGAILVVSGKAGTTLRTLLGPGAWAHYGSSVAGLGDVDGDGRSDLLVGASNLSRAAEFAGALLVHSGASGALLYSLDGPHASAGLGHAVCALPDLDSDGIADFAATTHEREPRVRIHSGKDGALLIDYPGSTVALAGDLDRDGRAEIVTGLPNVQEPGVVSVWSPARDLARREKR
jgi:hypothetical protein